jgi:hypothetical protein
LPSPMMMMMSSPATIVFVCWTLVEAAPFTFQIGTTPVPQTEIRACKRNMLITQTKV